MCVKANGAFYNMAIGMISRLIGSTVYLERN